MRAKDIIERALNSSYLMEELEGLIVVPKAGATDEVIKEEENLIKRKLSKQHKDILKKWNGINLEVVRLYGCGSVDEELDRLSDKQMQGLTNKGQIVIGSDPSGFIYLESFGGAVSVYDPEGDEIREIARDLDDFFCRLVFGKDAREFAGEDWETDLIKAGILPQARSK